MSEILKVGDTAWFARAGNLEVTRPCPVCFGKRVVRLELGNGELIATPCEYCGKGWDGPQGFEKDWEWVAAVEQVTISRVSIEQDGATQTAKYHTAIGHYIYDTDLFPTKEEAETRVAVIIAEHVESERKRRECLKEYAHKNFAWHVGYHRREAKKAKASMEWHETRAIACKALAKTPVETEVS